MAVTSGKNGTLSTGGSEEAAVTDWQLNTSSANDAYAANDTGGWKKREAGVKDATGSFNMKDKPTFNEGDKVALVLYTGDQYIYTMASAIIDDIDVTTDMNDGTIVSWAINFSTDGAVVESTGSAP